VASVNVISKEGFPNYSKMEAPGFNLCAEEFLPQTSESNISLSPE
jgi:hypothetical protein